MAFKQKSGSPFQRNGGIGKSPTKQTAPMKDSGKAGLTPKQLGESGFEKVAEKHDKLHADWAKNPGKGTAPHAEMEEKSPRLDVKISRSPMKQLPLYTCPECGAEFELPEELAAHFEDHLSGGPGGGNYPDQDDFFIDTEGGEDTPTTTTTTGRFRDE